MARRPRSEPVESRWGEIKHLSYSTLDAWFSCPKQVELRKIRKAPARPAWWFAGGSAVHSATEAYDRWTLLDPVGRPKFSISEQFNEAFLREVEEIRAKEPDESLWRHAGPKTAPETFERWAKNGPLFVGNYITWRRTTDYVVWRDDEDTGDDPAIGIETDLSCVLPGCAREVKAYADRIFWTPALQQIHIIDLKTGTRGPRTPLQFGTYAACLKHKYGIDAATGAAFMNREGALGKPFSLAKYDPRYVGLLYGNLHRAVDAKVFPAHYTGGCSKMCDVSDACYAAGGARSGEFDPDDPQCPPF